MAVRGQMVHRQGRADAIVDRDTVYILGSRDAVDKDHWQAKLTLAQQYEVVTACGDDDQAIDLAAGQSVDKFCLTLSVAIAAAREDERASPASDVFDGAVDS